MPQPTSTVCLPGPAPRKWQRANPAAAGLPSLAQQQDKGAGFENQTPKRATHATEPATQATGSQASAFPPSRGLSSNPASLQHDTAQRPETSAPLEVSPHLAQVPAEQPAAQQPAVKQRMTRLGRHKLVRQRTRASLTPTTPRSRARSTGLRRQALFQPPGSVTKPQQPRLIHRGLHRLVLATATAKAARSAAASPKSPRLVRRGRHQLAALAQSPLLRRLSLTRAAGVHPVARGDAT